MKRIIALLAFSMTTLGALAQETYENGKLAGDDLNGTARYVGMGGAMEALGADVSTISTNPAGIGMFRKSCANLSMGFVTQQDVPDFSVGKKTYMSFDQVGFVIAMPTGPTSFMNFAFNYHKSKNFDYILGAADKLYQASQQKVTYEKTQMNDGAGILYPQRADGTYDTDHPYWNCSMLDDVYAYNLDAFSDATDYVMRRSHTGYIGEYDFNISGNSKNRIYWGLTLGLRGVHYKHYGQYEETLYDGKTVIVCDDRKISGTGVDLKAGIIFLPVDESPFRVGLSVSTPTWYDLTSSNYTTIDQSHTFSDYADSEYDFNLTMPWKFGVSLGHTLGGNLALGASYEYTDYGSMDTRVKNENRNWDAYDSESDDVMNRHTEQTLRAVNTLKLGAEFRPVPEMAVRLGYNWVSPMYKKDGFKDVSLGSIGVFKSSATDYTNWRQTNRITCGLGYQFDKKLNLAVAYQYSVRKGDFEPFPSTPVFNDDGTFNAVESNIADVKEIDFKRHQLLFTATYSF